MAETQNRTAQVAIYQAATQRSGLQSRITRGKNLSRCMLCAVFFD